METATTARPTQIPPRWQDVLWPKEHGSWSLALEPVALGLLLAPSVAGGALACAAVAGFFARRPLKIAWSDHRLERRLVARRSVAVLAGVALTAAGVAGASSGSWSRLLWLGPSAIAGLLFLVFDLQQAGREQVAETCGAIAFASLPAVFAIFAGWAPTAAAAAGLVMLSRSVPTVLTVRATVRGRKTGIYHPTAALVSTVVAAIVVAWLAWAALVPWAALVLALVLTLRSFALLVKPRPQLRASTIGIVESIVGAVFIVVVALAWRLA